MPLFKTKFHLDNYYTAVIDETEHPLREVIKPLTPAQMLRRAMNGQPINCHKYTSEDRLIFNKRFFGNGDKMDAIDSAMKISKDIEKRRKQALHNLKNQKNTPSNGVGTVDPLLSTVPADTNETKTQ